MNLITNLRMMTRFEARRFVPISNHDCKRNRCRGRDEMSGADSGGPGPPDS